MTDLIQLIFPDCQISQTDAAGWIHCIVTDKQGIEIANFQYSLI